MDSCNWGWIFITGDFEIKKLCGPSRAPYHLGIDMSRSIEFMDICSLKPLPSNIGLCQPNMDTPQVIPVDKIMKTKDSQLVKVTLPPAVSQTFMTMVTAPLIGSFPLRPNSIFFSSKGRR